ncbi:MAG: hypothetical protein ACMVY4_07580 [Minwuia sp.]|uniref:hypothetical protein n=1 Tax=Minwuia sp. TaxID=2493630 RepID=UPI003A8779D3
MKFPRHGRTAALVTLMIMSAAAAPAIATPQPPHPNPARMTAPENRILSATDFAIYEQAFSLAEADNYDSALATAETATDKRLVPVLQWLRLRSGDVIEAPAVFDRFLAQHPDFPQQGRLLDRREAGVIELLGDAEALVWFGRNPPRTGDGMIHYAMLLKQQGRWDDLKEHVRTAWREERLGDEFEKKAASELSRVLAPADHWRRLDRLVWDGQRSAARRMKPFVGPDAWLLADARLQLHFNEGGADRAYRALTDRMRADPGVVYERVRWHRRGGRDGEAQALLLQHGALAGENESLWIERRIQVRNLIADGDHRTAYRIARDHGVASGAAFAQAEFEAGWLALRFLGDPVAALGHFQTLHDGVGYPISLSRGAYWSGRALAAQGNAEEAKAWFERAAEHATTFYGQLALHELGQDRLRLPSAGTAPAAQQKVFDEFEAACGDPASDRDRSALHLPRVPRPHDQWLRGSWHACLRGRSGRAAGRCQPEPHRRQAGAA